MTLKLEGDLDILKMYIHTENEVVILRQSAVLQTHRRTHRLTDRRRQKQYLQAH